MGEKPITKKEAETIKKELRKFLETAIIAAEKDDFFALDGCVLTIHLLLEELRKGLHSK